MHSPVQVKSPRNRLLTLLSRVDYERLQPHLQPVQLPYRRVLYAANKPIQFVYFLQTGVGSLVSTMHNGAASEVGTIGNEGLVRLPILLGDNRGPTSVYVQVPGEGFEDKICASLESNRPKLDPENNLGSLCACIF